MAGAATRATKPREPPDLNLTPLIRSQSHQTLALRSRSNGSDLKIPLRPGHFAKEPLRFMSINPQSTVFKSNHRWAQNLAQTPLNFPVFEPAV